MTRMDHSQTVKYFFQNISRHFHSNCITVLNMILTMFTTLSENPFGTVIVFAIITLCFLYLYYIFKWIRDFMLNTTSGHESGTISGPQRIDPEMDSSIVLVTVETSRNSKKVSSVRPSTNSTSGSSPCPCSSSSMEKQLVTSTQSAPIETSFPMKATKSMSNPAVK